MQSNSIKVLCQKVMKVASNLIVKGQSEDVSTTFTKTFELFVKCHKRYNSNVVTNSAIKQTGNCFKYLSNTPKFTIDPQNKTSPLSLNSTGTHFPMPPSS